MEDPAKTDVFLECPLSIKYCENDGAEIAGGEAKGLLETEGLILHPSSGQTLTFPYRTILSLQEADYRISLSLTSREKLEIFFLGYQYENFLKTLYRLRNEVLLKDMLMQESLKKGGLHGEFAWNNSKGELLANGECEPRLYDTGLVLLPERSDPIRIPYSELLKVNDENYTISLLTESGESLILRQMGSHHDPFKKALQEARSALVAKTQAMLKEIFPQADGSLLRRAGDILKEGKAAPKKDLDALSPELWTVLEERLKIIEEQGAAASSEDYAVEDVEAKAAGEEENAASITKTYAYLKSLAQSERMAIGIKRGLLGDLTGEYLWMLIPIYSENPNLPGNVIAMEAASTAGGGKATYFFRLTKRDEYRQGIPLPRLHEKVGQMVKEFNRAMWAINFRREPIYMNERQLADPRYLRYQYSIARIPELRKLRELFVGRVAHTSWEKWQKGMEQVMQFNLTAPSGQPRFQND
jgi:hypothetical protein